MAIIVHLAAARPDLTIDTNRTKTRPVRAAAREASAHVVLCYERLDRVSSVGTRRVFAVICGGTRTRRAQTLGMTMQRGREKVALVPPGTWDVDPTRSTAGFAVRHLKVTKVHGRFFQVTGVVRCDSEGVASIDGSVEVASIDTGYHRRDARLCAEDFFDVEQHPRIALTAVSLPVAPGDTPTVLGTMTVRGASRPLELQLEAPASPVDGNGDLRIRANGVVSRRDFGLEWDSAFAAGGLVIDDRVALRLDIVVVHPIASARHEPMLARRPNTSRETVPLRR